MTKRECRSKQGHDQPVKFDTTSQKRQLPPRSAKSRIHSRQKGLARKSQLGIVASILVDCASGVLPGLSSSGSRDGVSSEQQNPPLVIDLIGVQARSKASRSSQHTEDSLGDASGDLPMPGSDEQATANDMPENVVEDTLADLNRMSPETRVPKVIPFRAIPYRLRYCAENLPTTRLYYPFQRCPPLARDNKGRYTKKAKHILAVWEANKSLFGGLFHNPVPNGT